MTVETYSTKETVQQTVARLVESAKANARLKLVDDEGTEPVTLRDGTEAILLITEFIKESRRHSLQLNENCALARR